MALAKKSVQFLDCISVYPFHKKKNDYASRNFADDSVTLFLRRLFRLTMNRLASWILQWSIRYET